MSNLSDMLSVQQAAEELGVSTRTLSRWEENGYFVSEKIPNTKISLYHSHTVGYLKRVLNLDRSIRDHLKLLDGLRKRLDENMLEQDYLPGHPLRLMDADDIKRFSDAYDAMEKWEEDYKKLLDELMIYPRQMLKATVEPYDE